MPAIFFPNTRRKKGLGRGMEMILLMGPGVLVLLFLEQRGTSSDFVTCSRVALQIRPTMQRDDIIRA